MEITQHGSHLDHMLNQTRLHHAQISAMADIKANILMTIYAVVITRNDS
jgi:hypothetical protein